MYVYTVSQSMKLSNAFKPGDIVLCPRNALFSQKDLRFLYDAFDDRKLRCVIVHVDDIQCIMLDIQKNEMCCCGNSAKKCFEIVCSP